MATRRLALSTPEGDFAGQLLAEREVAPRAEVIAQEAAVLLEGCAINVYLDASPAWPVKGRVGETTVEESYEAATLARLAERQPGNGCPLPVPLPDGLSGVANHVRFSPQREKNSSFEAEALPH